MSKMLLFVAKLENMTGLNGSILYCCRSNEGKTIIKHPQTHTHTHIEIHWFPMADDGVIRDDNNRRNWAGMALLQQLNMEEEALVSSQSGPQLSSIPSPLLAHIYALGVSAVSRWILMYFKEVSPVLSSPPSLPPSPPSLSLSPPCLLRAADPRGLGALRRARRSDSQGPRWPPTTRGTALTRRPAPASSSPSEGRTPRACSWSTALFYNFQQERERWWCWWCARDGGFPFCASVDWCTSVTRAAQMPKTVTDAILDITWIIIAQTKRQITTNRPVFICFFIIASASSWSTSKICMQLIHVIKGNRSNRHFRWRCLWWTSLCVSVPRTEGHAGTEIGVFLSVCRRRLVELEGSSWCRQVRREGGHGAAPPALQQAQPQPDHAGRAQHQG